MDAVLKQYSNGANNTNSVLRRASQFESRQQESNNDSSNSSSHSSLNCANSSSNVSNSSVTNKHATSVTAQHGTKMPTPRSSLKRRVTPTSIATPSVPSQTTSGVHRTTTSQSVTTPSSPSMMTCSTPSKSHTAVTSSPSSSGAQSLPLTVSSCGTCPQKSSPKALEYSNCPSSSSPSSSSNFYSVAFSRFQTEFASLYPDDSLPFDGLSSPEDVSRLARSQQARIMHIQKQLSVSKFVLKFLESLSSHRDPNQQGEQPKESSLSSVREDESPSTNKESVKESSNSQYVTVITLNDSTYGEIQRPKPALSSTESSPECKNSAKPCSQATSQSNNMQTEESKASQEQKQSHTYANADMICSSLSSVGSSTNNDHCNGTNDNEPNQECNAPTSKASNSEPIYLNTVESQTKPINVQCTQRKRPPTPPRKPKLGKMQGSSCDLVAALECSTPISKSDSLSSIPRVLRARFSGPVQPIDLPSKSSQTANKYSTSPSTPFQTFSLEKTPRVHEKAPSSSLSCSSSPPTAQQFSSKLSPGDKNTDNDNEENDNIYDTVAPDNSEEATRRGLRIFEEDSNLESRDEACEGDERSLNDNSSQHDMLSRCSSTDEVSNYVNIDYFLRKNSLGRSHSNILGSTHSFGQDNYGLPNASLGGRFINSGGNAYQKQFSLDPSSRFLNETETETTLSSMKSSDYDNFSSNENLIDSNHSQYSNSNSNGQQQQSLSAISGISNQQSSVSNLSASLKSLNSLSTNESSMGSNQKGITKPMLNKNSDFLPSSYPPPMSTFTPPIRDKNQAMFSFPNRDKPSKLDKFDRLDIEKVTPYCVSPCSDPNLSSISQKSTPEKVISARDKSIDKDPESFYAYTDILDPQHKDLHNSSNNSSNSLPDKTCVNEENLEDEMDAMEQSLNSHNSLPSSTSLSPYSNKNHSLEIDQCQQMQWNIIQSIIQSEGAYLDCLKTLDQYEKALKSNSGKENSLISCEDLATIFYRIADLKELHTSFLNGLKVVEHGYKMRHSPSMAADSILTNKLMNKRSAGELFFNLASNLSIYSDFLHNYSHALETANRCIASNKAFSEIVKQIKIASLKGQFTTLIDLLHEPIARLQKNAMVIHDLLKFVDQRNEEEKSHLEKALKLTQTFLAELNLDFSKKFLPPIQEKFQRRLVKDSFIIDNCNDRRKLRHLFLFNDVIVCAKYKASTKQRYTFEVKWFQMLSEIVLDNSHDAQRTGSGTSLKNTSVNSTAASDNLSRSASLSSRDRDQLHFDHVDQIKIRTFAIRYDMLMEEQKRKGSSKVSEKVKKKLSELESELVLYLPNLRFSFHPKNHPNRPFVFLMSSEFERESWIEAVRRMQNSHLMNTEQPSLSELQRWVDTCRASMNPNLGSFLLRGHKDESLCFGDLYFRIIHYGGLDPSLHQNIFFVIETDSYGHYFKHCLTKYVDTADDYMNINQEFLVELEGCQYMRLLCYEDIVRTTENHDLPDAEMVEKSTVNRGKAVLDLNCLTLSSQFQRKEIIIYEHTLVIEMCFRSWNEIMSQFPANKICGQFGMSVEQVCKKEKSKIPYLILSCIKEVERRGLREVGIYRISGLTSDIQKLKKAFEMSPREAMWLIREIDIHAVTGMFKLYLRELAESMVPKEKYSAFKEIRDIRDADQKDAVMRQLLEQLPEPNQTTVRMMIDHLARVNRYEEYNKMSLQNLATIFGPTMLKTATNGKESKNSSGSNYNLQASSSGNSGLGNPSMLINSDLFTSQTIDVLAQAEILYCFIHQKARQFNYEVRTQNDDMENEREQTSL